MRLCTRASSIHLAFLLGLIVSWAHAQSVRTGWGAVPYHDTSGTGVTFRVWAPNASSVSAPGQFNGWSTTATQLVKEISNGQWNGIWSADVANVFPGQEYRYYISYSGGAVWRHDPRARKMVNSGPNSNDIIYDPTAFNWTGDALQRRSLADLVIYELHVGTFYDPTPSNGVVAGFSDAINRLDYVKALGASAIELMPICEFPGDRSWGYNLADVFAPESAYGGPDGLKTLVKAAHQRGLTVLLDVVHNHYGPSDLSLWNFDGWSGNNSVGGGGIYFFQDNPDLQITPWGATRPNFSSPQVSGYIQDSFRMWLDDYHVDGFRWDTPGAMLTANNGAYIDAAASVINNVTWMTHMSYPGAINIAEDRMGYGFDSTWDTTFPDVFRPVLTAYQDADRDMGVVANAIVNSVRFNVPAGMNRVVYLESHDVVGDLNSGTRLPTAIDASNPISYWARKRSMLGALVTFTVPGIPMLFQGQEMLEIQQFSDGRPVDWSKTNTYSSVVTFYRDLIRLRRNLNSVTAGLKGEQCSLLQVDHANKLVAYRRWANNLPNQDVVVIANFANAVRSNYNITFPRAGNWHVQLNTDKTTYGADYGNVGSSVVRANQSGIGAVTLGPYGALVLSQFSYPPALSVQLSNATVTVSWPIAFSGWVLDSAIGLSGSPVWSPVPPGQYQATQDRIFIAAPASEARFYRLRNPNS